MTYYSYNDSYFMLHCTSREVVRKKNSPTSVTSCYDCQEQITAVAHQREVCYSQNILSINRDREYERQQSETLETQFDTLLAYWFKALKRLFKLDDRCRGRYSLSGQISLEIPPGTP